MSPEELATIQAWVKERYGETAWTQTRPDVWARVPADAVWAAVVNVPEGQQVPTPGQVRQATMDAAEPKTAGWEEWAEQMGYKGASFAEAVRRQHGKTLLLWTPDCRCFTNPDEYGAAEHTACHQRDCDVHEAMIAAWEEEQEKKKVSV